MNHKYYNRKLELEKIGFELDDYLYDLRNHIQKIISGITWNEYEMARHKGFDKDNNEVFMYFPQSNNLYVYEVRKVLEPIFNKYEDIEDILDASSFFIKKSFNKELTQVYYVETTKDK